MQMTWPGAPTVYYGDEAGVCGFTDPDNRRTYPWGREDKELINFHREIIRIHRQNKEFKTGSLKCLTLDYNFLAYGRFTKNNHSVVLINNNENEITKELSVWELGIPRDCTLQRLILTGERGYDISRTNYGDDAEDILHDFAVSDRRGRKAGEAQKPAQLLGVWLKKEYYVKTVFRKDGARRQMIMLV